MKRIRFIAWLNNTCGFASGATIEECEANARRALPEIESNLRRRSPLRKHTWGITSNTDHSKWLLREDIT